MVPQIWHWRYAQRVPTDENGRMGTFLIGQPCPDDGSHGPDKLTTIWSRCVRATILIQRTTKWWFPFRYNKYICAFAKITNNTRSALAKLCIRRAVCLVLWILSDGICVLCGMVLVIEYVIKFIEPSPTNPIDMNALSSDDNWLIINWFMKLFQFDDIHTYNSQNAFRNWKSSNLYKYRV